MALVCPDAGEIELLRKQLRVDEDFTLRLYTAISPALGESTVIGHMTEATFTGYTAKTLTKTSWPTPTTSAGVTSSTYAQQTWTHGGGAAQTILGYYVVGVTSGVLLWAEAFAASRTLNPSDQLQLSPYIELA